MLTGSCHCGAVTVSFVGKPAKLTICNCSICRRLGALWGHGTVANIRVRAAPDSTIRYIWGDKGIAFHSCKTCGCTTHWEGIDPDQPPNMAMNMALVEPAEICDIPRRQFDGADTWTYLN